MCHVTRQGRREREMDKETQRHKKELKLVDAVYALRTQHT